MSTESDTDPDRTESPSKQEVCHELRENVATGEILPVRDAVELAAPWGDSAVASVRSQAQTYRELRKLPRGDTELDDHRIHAYKLVQTLVRAEGVQPVNKQYPDDTYTAGINYVANLPLLLEAVEGIDRATLNDD